MNTCPIYRRSGGHSYDYVIPGPIGSTLGTFRDPKKNIKHYHLLVHYVVHAQMFVQQRLI